MYEIKSKKLLAIVVFSFAILGCTISPGFSAGSVPSSGMFTANNGISFRVQELTSESIPQQNVYKVDKNNSRYLLRSIRQYSYRISKGDVVGVFLPDYPEITPPATPSNTNLYSMGFLVDQQGSIQFPLIGRIRAEGMSLPDLTKALSTRLLRYLTHPDPQVRILAYRGGHFYIDGEVKSPGQYNLTDQPISLYGAIGMAGGSTTKSDSDNITLIRQGRQIPIGFGALQRAGISPNELLVENGDSIRIDNVEHNKVYVVGEFGKPSPVVIPNGGLSLSGVLGEANGLNPSTANATKVYVLRENRDKSASIYYLSLKDLTNFSLANRFMMAPNDIVYVDPTGLTRWNRVINLLLPSAASAANVISNVKGL